MSDWFIVIPEATTNLITNPSFETNTTGWTAGAGSLVRSSAGQRRGIYSGAYTPSSATTDGLYYAITLSTTTSYTFSIDFYGTSAIPFKLRVRDQTAGTDLATQTFTAASNWQRKYVSFTTGANTSIRLYVEKNSSSSTTVFYIDGAQCEAQTYPTTYIDGDRDGCLWSGAAHGSTSTRSAQYYGGGKVVDISQIQVVSSQNRGFVPESWQGVGMPPIQNISTRPALGDGSIFQDSYASERVLTLIGGFYGPSLVGLSRFRKTTIDTLKLDKLATKQPVQLRYAGYDDPVAIDCYYDDGLGFGSVEGYTERTALKFIAYDPYWKACVGTGQDDSAGNGSVSTGAVSTTAAPNAGIGGSGGIIVASVQTDVANANCIVQRNSTGTWSALSTGLNDTVRDVAIDNNSVIYAAGNFTTAGGIAAVKIAKYSGGVWSTLGDGLTGTGAAVYAMAIGSDGALYVGGNFTTAGTSAASKVAKWDGSVWSALGAGLTGGTICQTLCFGPDGTLYAGGNFTTAGTGAAAQIAKWDGSAWSTLGTGMGGTGTVYGLTMGLDGTLYAGGSFSTAGGTANTAGVAKWNGSAWVALGSGADTNVVSIIAGLDGSIYLGGATTAGGIAVNKVGKWNGSNWTSLGSGIEGASPVTLTIHPLTGHLYAGGQFTTAGGLALPDGIAFWNGTIWNRMDIDLPGTATVNNIVITNSGTIILGGAFLGTAIAAAIQ